MKTTHTKRIKSYISNNIICFYFKYMKYFYTYRVDCTAPGWEGYYYLGQHTTSDLDDGYKGSGTKLQEYYKQYPNDYIFTILEFYLNKSELSIAEQKLIGDLWETDIYCLNSTAGGSGGFKAANKYWKGRKLSEEHKKHIGAGNKGKHLSSETKHKISEANKGRKQSEIEIQNRINKIKGRKNPNCAVNTGKHRVYREDGTFYMSF